MPSLPAAVSWLLSQRAAPRRPGVWKAQDAADLAGVPVDRALAYLRRVEVAGAVLRLPDGSFTAGPRRLVAQWRASRGKATSEGGNSAEYRRARAVRERIQAAVMAQGGVEEPEEAPGSGPILTSTEDAGLRRLRLSRQTTQIDQEQAPMGTHDMMATIATASQQLGVSHDTIERGIRRGSIKAVRFGRAIRIPVPEVERLKREGLTYARKA